MDWTDEQLAVIEAPPRAQQLVEAPPGSGKTAVACARVAFLLDWGVSPSNILLLSFTRTAVAELRERISVLANESIAARAVRITTLDSEAWHFRYGFAAGEAQNLFDGFDPSVEKVVDLLQNSREGDELIDYLSRFDHLIIDEAQDVTGVRAKLCEGLLQHVRLDCGFTIFADPHQAIYGFTTEDGANGGSGDTGIHTFLGFLQNDRWYEIDRRHLSHIFRTSQHRLCEVIMGTREILADPKLPPARRYDRVRRSILQNCYEQLPKFSHTRLEGRDDVLVLFRRRAEVVHASHGLAMSGVPHRLRMSGLPVPPLRPWLARVLADCAGTIDQSGFEHAWRSAPGDPSHGDPELEKAWQTLLSFAGTRDSKVDLSVLRNQLARSRPPAEFCSADIGFAGPVLGTIHASKGREASEVHLMLPPDQLQSNTDETDEECRVLYVGATRARDLLVVGDGYSARQAGWLLSGAKRAWHIRRERGRIVEVRFEIGLEGDFVPWSVVEGPTAGSEDEIREGQRVLASLGSDGMSLSAGRADHGHRRYGLEYRRGVGVGSLGYFSEKLEQDLRSAVRDLRTGTSAPCRLPQELPNIFITAVRSVVLPIDSPHLERIPSPWKESGMFLAPIVRAYCSLDLSC